MTHALLTVRQLALAVATLACLGNALAAQPDALAQAQARYRQDMAVCNSGQSNQTPATCRREAGSALAQAKHGDLDHQSGAYTTNALQRCAVHTGDALAACQARILGQGDISQQSQAGGLLRQSITVTPTP